MMTPPAGHTDPSKCHDGLGGAGEMAMGVFLQNVFIIVYFGVQRNNSPGEGKTLLGGRFTVEIHPRGQGNDAG